MFKILEDFKISLLEDGKSSKTIESYVGDINSNWYCKEDGTILW